MKITLSPTERTGTIPQRAVDIAIPGDDWCLRDVMDELVKPALIAWGFHPENIEKITLEKAEHE